MADHSGAAVVVEGLRKSYKRTVALDGLSFTVPAGIAARVRRSASSHGYAPVSGYNTPGSHAVTGEPPTARVSDRARMAEGLVPGAKEGRRLVRIVSPTHGFQGGAANRALVWHP